MQCLLALIAAFFPRIVIALLALFSNYMSSAYETLLWPLLGFVFMPFTTLAYALAINSNDGSVSGLYLVIVIVAALLDLGAIGGGSNSYRRKYRTMRK